MDTADKLSGLISSLAGSSNSEDTEGEILSTALDIALVSLKDKPDALSKIADSVLNIASTAGSEAFCEDMTEHLEELKEISGTTSK